MVPSWIVLHHSLSLDRHELLDWDAVRHWHIDENGWRDIGYHFGIELVKSQSVYEILVGRMPNETGAHCTHSGMNRKSIGICMIGNFDEYLPSDALLIRLRKFTLGLMNLLDIPPENVIGHRDAGLMDGFDWRKGEYKSCPGKRFPLDEFKLSLI